MIGYVWDEDLLDWVCEEERIVALGTGLEASGGGREVIEADVIDAYVS